MQNIQLKSTYKFSEIKGLLSKDLLKVEDIIINKLKSEIPLINDLTKHILSGGGKKIRPIITLISSYLCNYNSDKHLLLAATVEFIHTATLLHDDVVDQSKLRRGDVTANDLFGNKASVLTGDFFFTKAFELMVESKSLEVLKLLSKASSIIAQGEILQLTTSNDCNITEKKYTEVIYAKTASLFSAASEIGSIISQEEEKKRIALKNYGKNLGLAFQIIDDLLDYTGQTSLGKTLGDDFREGKITFPVIVCLKNASSQEIDFWERTMQNLKQKDGDFEIAINFIKKSNAIKISKLKAQHYALQAIEDLKIFPNSIWKTALISLAKIVIERKK